MQKNVTLQVLDKVAYIHLNNVEKSVNIISEAFVHDLGKVL